MGGYGMISSNESRYRTWRLICPAVALCLLKIPASDVRDPRINKISTACNGLDCIL